MRPLTQQRFLLAYSATVSLAFILTVYFGFVVPVHGSSRTTEFDRIRVHRIDIVEPDGTERLILSNRSDYPGSFYHRREIARPDRSDSAGLLFINDEGSEDGGLIYGGLSKDGKPTSFGHLSFDQYEQDQTLSLDSELLDGHKSTNLSINDVPDFALTPEVVAAYEKVKAMPHGPERAKAWAEVRQKYPEGRNRASLRRNTDASVGLTLSDPRRPPSSILERGPGWQPLYPVPRCRGPRPSHDYLAVMPPIGSPA